MPAVPESKVRRPYPSTMSSPYLTGTLVEDVEMFSWSGENMDAVCVGEGVLSAPNVNATPPHTLSSQLCLLFITIIILIITATVQNRKKPVKKAAIFSVF